MLQGRLMRYSKRTVSPHSAQRYWYVRRLKGKGGVPSFALSDGTSPAWRDTRCLCTLEHGTCSEIHHVTVAEVGYRLLFFFPAAPEVISAAHPDRCAD